MPNPYDYEDELKYSRIRRRPGESLRETFDRIDRIDELKNEYERDYDRAMWGDEEEEHDDNEDTGSEDP